MTTQNLLTNPVPSSAIGSSEVFIQFERENMKIPREYRAVASMTLSGLVAANGIAEQLGKPVGDLTPADILEWTKRVAGP